jgi:bifunctional DNA-binding transcriptional regulator/antitoxin component of YhaV-PrlF toxin-antitoxin module
MTATVDGAEARAFETITRDRGVVTIPAELRQTAGIGTHDPVVWVELAPRVWLVAPPEERPTEIAPALTNALLAERSPFPKLMGRLAGLPSSPPRRSGARGYRRIEAPHLTEEQMAALGAVSAAPRHRRGRG